MLDEQATYIEEQSKTAGVVSLVMFFNKPTLELLKKWRTRIRATRWHREGDYATLVVSPRSASRSKSATVSLPPGQLAGSPPAGRAGPVVEPPAMPAIS